MIYWIANLIVIGFTSFLFWKKFKGDFSPFIFWSGLMFKLSAGITLGFVFLHFYGGGDSFLFFSKAEALVSQPFETYISDIFTVSDYSTTNKPRVLFFAKFLSPFVYLSGGSYWITALYMSLISFLASWWTVVRFTKVYPSHSTVLITCFLFIPSIVFWSSGILKDTITYSALLLLLANVLGLHKRVALSSIELLLAAVSIFTLYKLKHYALITFLLFGGLLLFLNLIQSHKIHFKLAAVLFLFITLVGTQFIHPHLNLKRLPLTIYENNSAIIEKSRNEYQLGITIENAAWNDVFREVPRALKTGLFRPSIFDRTPKIGWPHKLENFCLTLLTIISILILIKEKPKIDLPLAISASASIIVLSTLLSLSTPNFGTLVRYKNIFMPFFFLLVSILPYQYFFTKRLE